MQTRLPLVALVLMIAACGTPQERCIDDATRELRRIDGLIADTEAALARGYGYETRLVTRREWVPCPRRRFDAADGTLASGSGFCWDRVQHQTRVPVAIDPLAERRKLDGLRDRRRTLAPAAAAATESCRRRFPEAA